MHCGGHLAQKTDQNFVHNFAEMRSRFGPWVKYKVLRPYPIQGYAPVYREYAKKNIADGPPNIQLLVEIFQGFFGDEALN
jgi:hypothetical protein